MSKVTIRDVASQAQVSVATVSHIINGTHYVSPELRQRVLAAIEALDYRPSKLAQALNSQTIPVVILGDFVIAEEHHSNWDRVGGDNQGGAQSAVEHLIQLGHQRMAFIQGPADTPTSIRRLAGFRCACELASLPVSEKLLVRGNYTQEGGRQAMTSLLDLPDPPTAVFCANDLSALGALEVAQRRGYRIPQDLSIVGFDDIEEAAHTSPPLTTIRQSPRQLGMISAEKLIERLDGRTEPVRVAMEFSLIIRQSTAPPGHSESSETRRSSPNQ